MLFLLDPSLFLKLLPDFRRCFTPHLCRLINQYQKSVLTLNQYVLTTTDMFWCLTSTLDGMRLESVMCFLKRINAFRARLI